MATAMIGQFTILGSGGSMGIPVVGCSCVTCTSVDPKDKRRRSCALVSVADKKLLIDAGPDLREQLLSQKVDSIDGLLLTHAHNDHIAGLDDLRPLLFRRQKPLPLLVSRETLHELQARFFYLFGSSSFFIIHELKEPRGALSFEGVPLSYTTYYQGAMPVIGFRFGDLAYVSDIKEYPETIFEDLHGVHTLILSALSYKPSPVHLTVDDAIAFSNKVRSTNNFLTHIAHGLDHRHAEEYLPAHIRMAYDGLSLQFSIPNEG